MQLTSHLHHNFVMKPVSKNFNFFKVKFILIFWFHRDPSFPVSWVSRRRIRAGFQMVEPANFGFWVIVVEITNSSFFPSHVEHAFNLSTKHFKENYSKNICHLAIHSRVNIWKASIVWISFHVEVRASLKFMNLWSWLEWNPWL